MIPNTSIRHKPHRAGTPATTVAGKNWTLNTPATTVAGKNWTPDTPATMVAGKNWTPDTPATTVAGHSFDKNIPATTVAGKNQARFSIATYSTGVKWYQYDTHKLYQEQSSNNPGHHPVIFLYENYSKPKLNIMAEIKTMNVTKLLVASHYEFHRTAEALMTAAKAATLHIETLLPAYTEAVNLEFQIINYNQYLTNTALLKQLDEKRGKLLSRLFRHIDMAVRSPLEEERLAGEALKVIVSPYRGIAQNEYTKETAQLRGLARDLATEEASVHLDTLYLGEIEQKLRYANIEFATALDGRMTTEAVRPQNHIKVKRYDQQKIVNELYRQIILRINAFAIAEPTDEIDAFIELMNAHIDQYKRVISHLQPGGSGNEKVTPSEGEDESEESKENKENKQDEQQNN